MLDDLKYIHEKDAEDALGVVEKQWELLKTSIEPTIELGSKNFSNVVLSAMGGSAWPWLTMSSWPGLRIPSEISRAYETPAYVNEDTLVIVSSFSGNTEETISSFHDALSKKAQIIVIASGGELVKLANQHKLPLFLLPTGRQPRMSTFAFLKAFLYIIEAYNIGIEGSNEDLTEVADWLRDEYAQFIPSISTANNAAKQLAHELSGKAVIVYSGPKIFPVANKFKICLTENAKNLAWSNQYPELNHNEFTGWSSHPIDKPFAVVEIRSKLEHPRVYKRFEITERLLSGKRPHPFVIEPKGDTILQQILWGYGFFDFVSIYLALLNGVDPTPVDLVEKLKAELNR